MKTSILWRTTITGDIHKATTWSIVLSVLMIAAGVLAIFASGIAGVAVTLFFGWLLVFGGVLHIRICLAGAGRAGAVVLGDVAGTSLRRHQLFCLIARPVAGLESLTLAIAIYLVFEGILEFVLAFQCGRRRAAGGCCSTAS